MTTFSDLVNDVLFTMEGYGLEQGRSAFITSNPITATDLTVSVTSTDNLAEGMAEIGDELVYIQSVDDASSQITIAPDGRGYRNSVATTHPVNSRITMSPVLPRTLIKRKINETIVGLWPTVWGEATAVVNTSGSLGPGYGIPADVEEIVSVEQDGEPVRRWRLEIGQDTATYPTGKAVFIYSGPSGDVRIRYRKQPTELVNDTDDILTTGLRSTARSVIVTGAVWRLVSFMDPSRLKVNTAVVDQMDQAVPVGQATQVAGYLRRVYERELLDEQQRLQVATPPIIHYTG